MLLEDTVAGICNIRLALLGLIGSRLRQEESVVVV